MIASLRSEEPHSQAEPERAIAHAQRAMRLSLRDPLIHQMHNAIGNAQFVSGKYEEAAASALTALQVEPGRKPATSGP